MKLRVYIAGPYSGGDQCLNVRNAINAAELVVKLGGTPYIPHLNHLWELISVHSYDFWLEQDMEWLKLCHVFFRLPGESKGADIEEEAAQRHGLTICKTLDELEKALK